MPSPSKRTVTIIALILALALFATEFGWLYPKMSADNVLPDFIEFWAAERAILSRNNPYSPDHLLTLQQSAGWTKADPLMMYNPPWTFLFTLIYLPCSRMIHGDRSPPPDDL